MPAGDNYKEAIEVKKDKGLKIEIIEVITDAKTHDLVNEREKYWIKEEQSLLT